MRINTIRVKIEIPCRNAATRFLSAKIVLYQCTSIDIIQSKAERENVKASMKARIFEYSSLFPNSRHYSVYI